MKKILLKEKSLRFQIMLSVSLVTFMIILSLFLFISMNRTSIRTIGNAYNSNTNLNTLLKNLSDLEYNMEHYNEYRTYESIDKNYIYKVKKVDYGYALLTNQKQFYYENYPKIVIQNCSIDDVIYMMIKGK